MSDNISLTILGICVIIAIVFIGVAIYEIYKDETKGFMWCPFINTALIIGFGLCLGVVKLWELSRLEILWKKFRNIRIR